MRPTLARTFAPAILFVYLASCGRQQSNLGSTDYSLGVLAPGPVWDAGFVEKGQVIEHCFTLVNNSTDTINIQSIVTGCGCTAANLSDYVMESSEEALLCVTISTLARGGVAALGERFDSYVDILGQSNNKTTRLLRCRVVALIGGTPTFYVTPSTVASKDQNGWNVELISTAFTVEDLPKAVQEPDARWEFAGDPVRRRKGERIVEATRVVVHQFGSGSNTSPISRIVFRARTREDQYQTTLTILQEPNEPPQVESVLLGGVKREEPIVRVLPIGELPTNCDRLQVDPSQPWITAELHQGELSLTVKVPLDWPDVRENIVAEHVDLLCGDAAIRRIPIVGWLIDKNQ